MKHFIFSQNKNKINKTESHKNLSLSTEHKQKKEKNHCTQNKQTKKKKINLTVRKTVDKR